MNISALIWLTFILFVSTVSSSFLSKSGGYPYANTYVRPDTYPYNNYGYGYSGYSTINSRPFNVFGNSGYGSSSGYAYPQNTNYGNYGNYGYSNPYFSQSYGTNPYSSGYNTGYNTAYNYQNPYFSRPYSFYPSGYGSAYKA